MDFGMLPPEINSGRMYSGPGSGPMMAAATAWDRLAAELGSAADAHSAAISGLLAEWQGPSSSAMAAAAAAYTTWMTATAAQAEQTATQLRDAVTAYQTAFAGTVPPPLIAANRAQLASLVSTNILWANTVGDRGHRGAVRGYVGPGCRGDVRLRWPICDSRTGDAVHLAAADHRSRRTGRQVRRRRADDRHIGRHRPPSRRCRS